MHCRRIAFIQSERNKIGEVLLRLWKKKTSTVWWRKYIDCEQKRGGVSPSHFRRPVDIPPGMGTLKVVPGQAPQEYSTTFVRECQQDIP